MKCRISNCENDVIYSGVDAFMLGVPTEKVCYECANKYNEVKNVVANYLEASKN